MSLSTLDRILSASGLIGIDSYGVNYTIERKTKEVKFKPKYFGDLYSRNELEYSGLWFIGTVNEVDVWARLEEEI